MRLVRISSRACNWICLDVSSRFLAIITLAIFLPSPKVSDRGERDNDRNVGVLRKKELSFLDRTGELERSKLMSSMSIEFAKSSRVVCSEQSMRA